MKIPGILLGALIAPGMACPALAEVSLPAGVDVCVLGEIHDNPDHHAEQARLTALIAPKVVVWEMLTPEQVVAMAGVDRADTSAMEAALAAGGVAADAPFDAVVSADAPARDDSCLAFAG